MRVSKHHTDIVYIAHNGEVMLNEQDDCECAQKLAANQAAAAEQRADRSRLSIEGIVEYAKTADLSTVSDLLNRQIEYNYNIAQAGVKENWGQMDGSSSALIHMEMMCVQKQEHMQQQAPMHV